MKKIKKSFSGQLTRAEAMQSFVDAKKLEEWISKTLLPKLFQIDIMIEALRSVGAVDEADMKAAKERLIEAAKKAPTELVAGKVE